jgi:hypothetical protein
MYLDDTINGKGWQYVQKFQPRNFYDVEENEKPNSKVAHEDDFTDPTPTRAAEIDEASEDTWTVLMMEKYISLPRKL